jgi:hypothetical protein
MSQNDQRPPPSPSLGVPPPKSVRHPGRSSPLDALAPVDRSALALALRKDLDPGEVAMAMGTNQNQARAKISRARTALTSAVTAVVLTRGEQGNCAGLDEALAGFEESLTPLMRKRVSRHVKDCDRCSDRGRKRALAYVSGFALPAAMVLPQGFQAKAAASVLSMEVSGPVPDLGPVDASGFPLEFDPLAPIVGSSAAAGSAQGEPVGATSSSAGQAGGASSSSSGPVAGVAAAVANNVGLLIAAVAAGTLLIGSVVMAVSSSYDSPLAIPSVSPSKSADSDTMSTLDPLSTAEPTVLPQSESSSTNVSESSLELPAPIPSLTFPPFSTPTPTVTSRPTPTTGPPFPRPSGTTGPPWWIEVIEAVLNKV